MKYLLSIVVPTKDRYSYLKCLIKLIESFETDQIELIIQDNTENNTDILDFIQTEKFAHLKYYHTPNQIPISDNSDKAILNSSGEYVCFIGDDDGVTENIIDCVRWMKSNNIEAVKSADVMYYWPDNGAIQSSTLKFKKPSGSFVKVDPYNELIKLCSRGLVDRGNLPVVYHGIVRRDVLDKIYEKCNTYFPGQSPDIANGVALSLIVKNFALVDSIVTIAGASSHHGGKHALKGAKYLEIENMPWLRSNARAMWDKRIPCIGVGEAIWANSAIEAMKSMKREDLVNKVDFESLYQKFYLGYPDLRHMIPNIVVKTSKWDIFNKYYNALISVLLYKYKINLTQDIVKHNVSDIQEVINIIKTYNKQPFIC